MSKEVFVDTWGWLALGHRKDPHHQEIKEFYQKLQTGGIHLCTSDYVLGEVITLLFRREVYEEAVHFMEGIFQAAEQGRLTIERITSSRFASAWKLRQRYKDKPRISFTDLTSMVIMEERRLSRIITEDEHFHHVGMGFQKVPE